MALDTRYIPFNYLQQYFVDKDTGLPLAGGVVTFYKDQARTQLKDIYQISGTPPNYTYSVLPNPLILSANGTFQDNSGNDISVYGLPYDDSGNVELYYITVYSSSAVFQFSREGTPNVGASTESTSSLFNFIPNGQFLLHNNIPATPTTTVNQVNSAVTILGPGGWTFERSPGATSKDYVTFLNLGSYVTNPSGSPRFACAVSCTDKGSGSGEKGLYVKFKDVNKFASDSQQYTLSFTAKNNSGSTADVTIKVYKYYGSGGSTPDRITKATKHITSTYSIYNTTFTFGNNTGKTIGPNNDDYVQIELSLPPDDIWDVSFTDFALVQGAVTIVDYPISTDADFITRSQSGWAPVPAYDGSNLGLKPIVTLDGLGYDTSDIGKVYPTTSETAGFAELLCDGSKYEYTAYSSDLIPYKRLGDKLWITALNSFRYGTGPGYFTGVLAASSNELRITNNTLGPVTNAADGASPTGFTISNIHKPALPGSPDHYYTQAYMVAADTFYLANLYSSVVTATAAGTSGFTVKTIQVGDPTYLVQISSIKTVAASVGPLSGKYFTFQSYHGATYDFYVWYKVAGVGSDPAPGGTGIEVNLETADTAAIVAEKTREALNEWQETMIKTTAVSAPINPGSYFTISSTSTNYYVWYTVNSVGTDPAISGKVGIKVELVTGDTAPQVALKTLQVINKKFYAVPDFRGTFLRGWDHGAGIDPDAASRWSLVPGIIGDMIGTNEYFQNQFHDGHTSGVYSVFDTGLFTDWKGTAESDYYNGGTESRPVNANINYIIKY